MIEFLRGSNMNFFKFKIGWRDLLVGLIISVPFSILFISIFLVGSMRQNTIQNQSLSLTMMLLNSSDSTVVSNWYLRDTDPNNIIGLTLERESYLDDGAIFYFRYELKENGEKNETINRSSGDIVK